MRERLLREAWVTGVLEHPNIVPVHDLVLDEQGMPRLVMKRIEGVEWGALIADEAQVRSRFGARRPLYWHLDVLRSVCNALEYAHSRGIIHRDIKPENVMVGGFGEVYVLDWGIALALDGRYGQRLDKTSDEERLAGTPRYAAPEMVLPEAGGQGVHTDVYLLGATLFHAVVGRGPHQGDSLAETSGGMPLPRSLTRIATSCPRCRVHTTRRR